MAISIIKNENEHVAKTNEVILAGGFSPLKLSQCCESQITLELLDHLGFTDMGAILVNLVVTKPKVNECHS